MTNENINNQIEKIIDEEMNRHTETKQVDTNRLLQILEERKFDFSVPRERPEPSLEIGGHTLATNGNIMNIQAGVKVGKSAAVDAIMAAQMSGGFMEIDTFEFKALNENGHAVIHIDTEQSRFDADALVRRSIKRSGIDESPPSWLQSYSLADVDIAVRRASLPILIEQAKEQHGGIFSILIDGVGDFLTDPNDPTLSFGLVDELQQLAIENDCVVITVLHENPNSEYGKTRGHLGSHLSRKAETNLRLTKDKHGITTIFSTDSRHCHIPKDHGFCFHWCDESQMHVGFGGMKELKEREKQEAFKAEVNEIGILHQGKYTYKQLVKIVENHRKIKERAAKAYIKKLREAGWIVEVENGRLSFKLDL
ncbi:hypothetical protein OAE98_03460 [Akkermansiaceae bacterium]|nr:hypothetical protein [bacterium]MDB4675825.1 hypothetical protein [Akkermansiaceae bacterium]